MVRCLYSESYSLSHIAHSKHTFSSKDILFYCYDFIKSLSVWQCIIKCIIIYRDMQDHYLHVCFLLISTLCLLLFVVDCGLVTRNRESSYRPSEFLMLLRDKHNARPLYRWREGERSTGCLIYSHPL